MENSVVDAIKNYSIIYNDQTAYADEIANDIDTDIFAYFGCFENLISDDDEKERINEIVNNADAMLDNLYDSIDMCEEIFSEFNTLVDEMNKPESIINTELYNEKFSNMLEELKNDTDNIKSILESCNGYATVVKETINSLKEKFPEEYKKYLETLDENKSDESEITNDIVESANKIFDELAAKRPETMFVENNISAKFSESTAEIPVITDFELKAFTEAIVACKSIKENIYNSFNDLYTKYSGTDLLNDHMGSVNNIIHECDDLIRIFSCAVDNPSDWSALQSAQSSVYRYESLQNDVKVISDALNLVKQRIVDGKARRNIGSRNIQTDIDFESINDYNELAKLVGDIEFEIKEYFDNTTCDENMRAWIVNRFNDLVYHFENYMKILSDISASTSINGGNWQIGIYGQDGMYGSLIGNEIRECNLVATEIKNVMRNPRKRY